MTEKTGEAGETIRELRLNRGLSPEEIACLESIDLTPQAAGATDPHCDPAESHHGEGELANTQNEVPHD